MYIIAKGPDRHPHAEDPHGEALVTVLSEGSFFGEIALVEAEICSYRIGDAPREDHSLIGFFKPDLAEILERKPDLWE